MSRKSSITGFALVLLSTTILSSQETQTGPPAQPSSSVYNRMRARRVAPQDGSRQGQQQTTQQFPGPAQQFPPEQQGAPMPGQRPPMRFPHPTAPQEQQPTAQSPAAPQAQTVPPNTVSETTPQAQPDSGLALKPANPPRISYAGGELTVAADNSAMSDIVAGIQRAIGAHVEGSRPDAERVFGQFSGTPRQVLNSILSGSRYDFILVGAIDDPGVVQKIILSPHGASSSSNSSALNQPGQRQNVPTPSPEDDDNVGLMTQQPVQEIPPQQQAPNQANVPSEQSQPPQPGQQQQVKTPEQLLQELQRLRQQQQQQPTNPR